MPNSIQLKQKHFLHTSSLASQAFSENQQELQAEVNAHRLYLQRVLDRGRAIKNGEVNQKCNCLSAAWEELEEACVKRSSHLNKAVKREQVVVTPLQTAAILMCFMKKCAFPVTIMITCRSCLTVLN